MSAKAIASKKETVKVLQEKLAKAKVWAVCNYQGFTVQDITALRRKLRQDEAQYCVVKNTMLAKAISESELPNFKPHLEGSTAILLGYKDPAAPLKTLVNFIKEIEKGTIKAGSVENVFVNDKQIIEISRLPSREVLLAKVLGALQSPMYGLLNVMQGPLRKFVYALDAVAKKKSS